MNTLDRTPTSTPDTVGASTCGSGLTGVLLAAWLAVTLARLLQAEPLASANDRSRWCTVHALAEDGTYQIDKIRQRSGWDTIDLVKHDGHFYSTKPPLLPTLVAGLYSLEKRTFGYSLDQQLQTTTRLLLLFVNVLPMLLALGLLGRQIRRFSQSTFTCVFVMMAATFGTLLNPFLTTFNNHTPGTVCVIFALCAFIPIQADRRRSGWLFALVGFWAAMACCMELPAAAFGLAMFALCFLANRKQTLVWFVPAALIPLAAFFYTNYLATGGWKPFYLYYGTEKYLFIDKGVPSYWLTPRGIDQAKDSPLVYFLHCTVGHHGVLSLSPMFVLTLVGWLNRKRWTESPLRTVHWLGLGLTLIVFGFFMTKTENYNYGGVSVALRWLLWLVPFWLLTMIPALDGWQPGRWGRGVCVALLAVSVFSAWHPFDRPWRQPWLFSVMQSAGWIDYSDPALPKGQPFHAWIRQLPDTDSPDPIDDYWIEFQGLTPEGWHQTITLADAGSTTIDGHNVRLMKVDESESPQIPSRVDTNSTRLIAFDMAALKEGRPMEEVVIPESQNPNHLETWKSNIQFARGLVTARPYQPGKTRYVRSPLRAEAFMVRHAASRVYGTDKKAPFPTIQRRDLWMTDDVPFGVLEFKQTLYNARTGEVIGISHLRATAVGQVKPFDRATIVGD